MDSSGRGTEYGEEEDCLLTCTRFIFDVGGGCAYLGQPFESVVHQHIC